MIFKWQEDLQATYKYGFCKITEQIAPEVLTDLLRLLPNYKTLFQNYNEDFARQACENRIIDFDGEMSNEDNAEEDEFFLLRDYLTKDENKHFLTAFPEFRKAFFDWCQTYCFEKYWLMQTGLLTLHYKCFKPNLNIGFFAYAVGAGWVPHGENINFELWGWRFTQETDEEFENKAIAAFKVRLREHITKTAHQAQSEGYTLFRRKPDLTRLKWLVRWSVQKRTVREIADEEAVNRCQKANKCQTADECEKAHKCQKVAEFGVDERTIWNAFEQFKGYDLPVRQKNKHAR